MRTRELARRLATSDRWAAAAVDHPAEVAAVHRVGAQLPAVIRLRNTSSGKPIRREADQHYRLKILGTAIFCVPHCGCRVVFLAALSGGSI